MGYYSSPKIESVGVQQADDVEGMGYFITYSLNLRIPAKETQRALEIFNHLHTDDMLTKYALGYSYPTSKPVKDCRWYSWVSNPAKPYQTLVEAFENWSIVETDVCYHTDPETGDFTVSGNYDDKWGQQNFLIEQLAPVLDDTHIQVAGEDGVNYSWQIENHIYTEARQEQEHPQQRQDADEYEDSTKITDKTNDCSLTVDQLLFISIIKQKITEFTPDGLRELKNIIINEEKNRIN